MQRATNPIIIPSTLVILYTLDFLVFTDIIFDALLLFTKELSECPDMKVI